MAIDWCDSVAHYGAVGGDGGVAQITTKWTANIIQSARCVPGAGPRGNQVLSMGSGVAITRSHQESFIWGWRFNATSVQGIARNDIYTASHVGTTLCSVALESDATVSLYGGDSVNLIKNSGSLPVPFKVQPQTYYYFEVQVSISSGSPCTVDMVFRVNGVQLMSGSGPTQSSLNQLLLQTPTANNHRFSAASINGPSYGCDFVFIRLDGSGIINNFIGDAIVGVDFPDADVLDGWQTTGTPQFTQINETIPDGDTTYIYESTAGAISAFTYTPIQPFQGQVLGVHYLAYARKDNEGTRQFTLLVGGAQPPGMPVFSPSDEYIYYSFFMDADPQTGVAWTQSGFNAKVFGIKLIS